MSTPSDLAALTGELARLRRQVEAQAVELAQLRAAAAPEQPRVSRRHLLTGLAGLGAAGAAGVVSASPAAADDGDPLLLGQENHASSGTSLAVGSGPMGGMVLTAPAGGPVTTLFVAASPDDGSHAIQGYAEAGFGVFGYSSSPVFPAVVGSNADVGPGVAAVSTGEGPQLYLVIPEEGATVGPPSSGEWAAGHLKVDTAGDLWACVAPGNPGTWTRLLREDTANGRVIPITPIRALDTRAPGGRAAGSPPIPGQRGGLVPGGTAITLDLAGVEPIPDTASGVIGNATVISPTGNGLLRFLPTGATYPSSSFDFTAGRNVSGGFTSGLGSEGLRTTAPVLASTRYHLVIDIAAYIT